MPKTDAERSREYRRRKNENKIKKPPKSSTERVRDFRARRMNMLNKQNENNSYNVNNNVPGVRNSDEGRLFLHVKQENGSDCDNNTEAGQGLKQNFIEVQLPRRNDDGGALLIPTVKQENDSDFDDYTGDEGTLFPSVKQEKDGGCDDNTAEDEEVRIPIVKLEYDSDLDGNTGNDTDSVYRYGSGAPGPSTEKKLRTEIMAKECVSKYSRQDFKPSETESTDTESRRVNKAPKTAAERGREFRARKALLRQQRKEQQERDAMLSDNNKVPVPPEIKIMEKRARSAEATRRWREKKRALLGLTKKQAKTAAERMREYRQRKKRARKGDQALDATVSTSSSPVNQAAGPSTINSMSAELQQQHSFLCTVCNRLCLKNDLQKPSDNYEDLTKKVTNINNINNAMICSTCEVALDKQQHMHGQLDTYGDEGPIYLDVKQDNDSDFDANTEDEDVLIPIVKLEYDSDLDGNTGNDTDSVYGSSAPGPSTEKKLRTEIMAKECVSTYSRQDFKPSETESTDNESRGLDKAPKTSAERAREFRARKAQQRKQRQERDATDCPSEDNQVPKHPLIRIIDRRVFSGPPENQAKTVAERMREYRQRKKRARKGDQDLDATTVSTSSSQVNQAAGPSTINSMSAELQQQHSFLCTVCNRLCLKNDSQKSSDNYEDLTKKVTNINNINDAMICSTCEVALEKQRHVHGQFGIYGDEGTIFPEAKQENDSDHDDNTAIEKMLSSNARKCRNYRNRKKQAALNVKKDESQKIQKKPPKTPAERARLYRLRKKQLAQESKLSANEVLSTASTSDSQMTLEPSPQPVTTEAGQAFTQNFVEVDLASRNDGDEGPIYLDVKQDNDSDFDANTEAGQAFEENFIQVELQRINDDDEDVLVPIVKLEYDSDLDGNTESQAELVIEKEPGDYRPRTIEQSLSTNEEKVLYSAEEQANLNETEELSDLPFILEKDQLDCPVCHETFLNFATLNMHMNEHYPNHTCNNCGKSFASEARLKGHLKTHQAGVFPCRYCDAVFDNVIKKQNHVSKEHKSGDVACKKCNISLPSFYARQKHLAEVHNEKVKRYKCKACTQSYITPGHLSVHVRRDHLNERNYKCTTCDLAFYSINGLKMHMIKHDGE